MLGLVDRPDDISLSRANQSQAKFKSAVGRNLLQSWVNLIIVVILLISVIKNKVMQRIYQLILLSISSQI